MKEHETKTDMIAKFPKTCEFANKDYICKVQYNLAKVLFRNEEALREAKGLRREGYYTKIITKTSRTSVLPLKAFGVYKRKG